MKKEIIALSGVFALMGWALQRLSNAHSVHASAQASQNSRWEDEGGATRGQASTEASRGFPL